jgi:hypothetical protein
MVRAYVARELYTSANIVNRLQGESPGSDFDSQQGAEIFTFNTVA